ncbi:PAS domain-containing sensor histidine kinase [Halolactibacillus alkaliphilus]|uniref:histidine kinase n=1 Tax=Halolactibacillus alkaliphilus TaxID=442899 RepID=A0A511X0G7_9BACI|nr:cell wall metabolism sensor histidine kinase WalK [Halolactibacillus alkaliphilus]GEN56439.1 PAS domain-containing sensor histidine kinase [Halolactibacillus alkaliphilus]GGN64428.1 PAS domain-containing sensor histidine kinase [Halolactibacillus alkaliphilus]SFO61108.1 two-component system, OmpR family, sensor histidine kinase VicK [Halolactibacillus alkaliphilus]
MKKVSFFQSIRWKIIAIMILLLLLAIQVIGAYFAQRLETDLKQSFEESIDERLNVLNYNVREAFTKDRTETEDGITLEQEIASVVAFYGQDDDYSRLQIVDRQFRIVGTNTETTDVGKLVSGESRVRSVIMSGTPIRSIERNPATGERHLVRIIPITSNEDESLGAIYLEASMEDVYSQLQSINQIFLNGTLIAIVISALVGILVAQAITKPITEMRQQAKVMAEGDFSQKVNVYGVDEIGQLAHTFNEMKERIKVANLITEEERRKLSSILSNMSDGVISTDEQGEITLMNEPAMVLLGQSFEQLKGRSLFEVLNIDESTVDILEMQDSGSITIDMSDDEQFFLLKANFTFVLDEYERFSGLITVLSDVTEEEKVERERREFVSNVSHELRTPLTTMRSYLEALTDGAWENKDIAPQFLEVTQNETERMIRLVNDLLQLSKMDHKEMDMLKERVNVIPFFHHVLDRFEMNKEETVRIDRTIPKDSIFLWLDKDKIIQVIDNIMSNALKYSPPEGVIRFRVTKERNRIKVMIQDQGPGIPPDKLDKIFDRFYRADRARSRQLGGTGLGLAIAREIIQNHHGQIWAESEESKGTKVFFTLPLIARKRGVS